jgi:hypothetical protein
MGCSPVRHIHEAGPAPDLAQNTESNLIPKETRIRDYAMSQTGPFPAIPFDLESL